VTLIDTGPLVALIDKADPTHQRCAAIFQLFSAAPVTTWPCLTEAFYLIGRLCGWHGQQRLLALLARMAVRIQAPNEDGISRIGELMEQYKDTPMDFADASLVVLSEITGMKHIFTLDDDFYFYKINGRDTFDVLKPDSA